MQLISGVHQLIVEFLHPTIGHTKLHTHRYSQTIKHIQLDTPTNRHTHSYPFCRFYNIQK
jgi:hypothetical protein